MSTCMGIVIACCMTAQVADVKVEGGLVVCIGEDALESVSNDWKKPGCIFYDRNFSQLFKMLSTTV